MVLGTGEPALEAAFREAQRAHPSACRVRIAYDEALAHRLIAGADVILVPSRFEPCGLTQMYGLRYGTLPLVRRVGGLADTVVDASDEALRDGSRHRLRLRRRHAGRARGGDRARAWRCTASPDVWRDVMRRAMAQDFSWEQAAAQYMELYSGIRRLKAG